MVQELMPFLPQQLSSLGAAICIAGIGVGLVFWLLGGVWSRGIVTLLAVALGGGAGMMLPRWFLWPINSMALATLGAVALGICAFAVPRFWVGLLLGCVLASWTCFGAWVDMRNDQPMTFPDDAQMQTLDAPHIAEVVWQSLPDPLQRLLPFAAATGLLSGLAFSLLWPRLSRAVCFSLTGLSLLLIAGLSIVSIRRPEWLQAIPEQAQIQCAIIAGLALLGIIVQWQFIPARKKAPQAPSTNLDHSDAPGPGKHDPKGYSFT